MTDAFSLVFGEAPSGNLSVEELINFLQCAALQAALAID